MRLLTGILVCWAMTCGWAMAQEDEGYDNYLKEIPPDPQVNVSVFMMKISPELAADWGLDGGPAAKPESTPLKKDIPKLLAPEEARKVISALRNAKGTEILASHSLIVQSGHEGFGAQAKEVMFPESYDDEDILFADPEGEPEQTIPKRPPKVLPKKIDELTIWDFNPVMGEPKQDIGLTLTVTPQVSKPGDLIAIDIHPKLTVDKKAVPAFFMFSTFEFRSQLAIPDGSTLIAFCGIPAPQGDYLKFDVDASTDRRPFIMFITAKTLEYPGAGKK